MKKELIFDRQQYLELLKKRIVGLKDSYRQNIALVGEESVGKTSIVFKFLDQFQDTRIIPLYIEARTESFTSFAKRFVGVLLFNFLAQGNCALQEDLGFLMVKSESYIPRTVAKIRQIMNALEKRKRENIFGELLSLCQSMFEETSKSCVVIFDEFQGLECLGVHSLYREWSKVLLTQKNTMYIIISSYPHKTASVLSKELSLLFGNFEVVNVEPFDIKTSAEFLHKRLSETGVDAVTKDFLVHFTGGYPFYLEIICQELCKTGSRNLVDIFEDLLFDSVGLLHQRYCGFVGSFTGNRFSEDSISILHLIACGRNKIKDIGQSLKLAKKDLMGRVTYLLEKDAITRVGDFLKINDRVFAFWLKSVHQEQKQSFTYDAKPQKIKFRSSVEELMRDFIQHSHKPFSDRVFDLLRLFEDETAQVERRKIKLTHFREVKPLEFPKGRITQGFLGRSQDCVWILGIKADTVSEADIAEFSRECKKFRHKLQRKIIITSADIDQNTRLRALEEKVWTWSFDNLNQILDLYSKPWVIV